MTRMQRFETPVVVILFNRPDRVEELLQVLRIVRPTRILAIADGPRLAHPDDGELCRQARAVLDKIDWPCSLEREFSKTNLGCDTRMVSGLTWAFARTDQAIVLEDDILPHPTFLLWAEAMLRRFAHDPTVGMICGRNPLGAWGEPNQDHIRGRNGSIWGWASTSRAWRQIQSQDLSANSEDASTRLACEGLDPLLRAHHAIALQLLRRGELSAWDVIFYLRIAAAGLHSITSPVNLIRNTGIGPSATRNLFAEDFNALLRPSEARPVGQNYEALPPDQGFDRASLLVQLLGRCRNPAMASRLATLASTNPSLPLDPATRHHLTPLIKAEESLQWLEHLASQGISSPLFNQLIAVLRARNLQHVQTP